MRLIYFVSLNSRLESNKEEKKKTPQGWPVDRSWLQISPNPSTFRLQSCLAKVNFVDFKKA